MTRVRRPDGRPLSLNPFYSSVRPFFLLPNRRLKLPYSLDGVPPPPLICPGSRLINIVDFTQQREEEKTTTGKDFGRGCP